MDGDICMFHGLRRDPRGRRDSAATFSSRLRNQDLDRSVHAAAPLARFQRAEPEPQSGLARRLRPIAQRHRTTVSAVAVAWVLAWPAVTGAIVGGRSPQQVDGWIGAASLQLTAADLQEISDAIVRTGAGEGPTIPQLEPADASR
jgi:aryl-alcohol dehydrogenase-like predicted oxidoreductase